MPSPTPGIRQTSAIMPLQIMRGHTDRIRCVAHLPDGTLITCSDDGSLRLWDLWSGTQIGEDWRDKDNEGRPVLTMALSPNGKTVATGSTAGIVTLWDIETKRVVTKWKSGDTDIWSVCWNVDGERVASGSRDGMVRVWEVECGETVLGPIQTGQGDFLTTIYSPDATKIVTGGVSTSGIKIYDAKTGKLLSTVEHEEHGWSLAWTSDQKRLISGSISGSIMIFDTATWQQVAILQGQTHRGAVRTISLSRSDRLLASASYDKTARLWNLDTYLPLGPPLQHEELVDAAAISTDGKLLVTGCMDGNAYIWDIQIILAEAGIEDLLSTPNVAAKSLMDTDATRLRAQREHARQVPRGFFDDGRDGVHSSARRLRSYTHRRHALTPSSTSHPYALLTRFSSLFRRSQLNTGESIELQQPPPRSAVSGHSPHAIDVAAVRDKEALYVARRPERTSEQATRIENPTWWTRCILFICCVSTQRTEGHQ